MVRDEDQCEALLQKINEQRPVRQWRTHILLPFIVLVSLWNLIDFTMHSSSHTKVNEDHDNAEGSSANGDYARRISVSEKYTVINNTVIDIISIGSLLRRDHQDAQDKTFGKHQFVRNLYRITERNDTDSGCFTSLTSDQLDYIIDFCANTKDESYISGTLRKRLFFPKKQTGWMCAQKRPLDGLHKVLELYRNNVTTIPDYLYIIDDDTYINVDLLTKDLLHFYPVNQSFAVAGCNMNFLKSSGITFPDGGFGTFLTKAAIQRLLQPIYCDGRDEHSTMACWRLNINALGEKQFFTEGMSVADLMQTYSSKLPFTEVESWTNTGYCFHSDHALAFFINFYHIPLPPGKLAEYGHPRDKMRRRHSFIGLPGGTGIECQNERDVCLRSNRVCHPLSPTRMHQLYSQEQEPTQLIAPIQQHRL